MSDDPLDVMTWQQLIDLRRSLKGTLSQLDRILVEKQLTRDTDYASRVSQSK